MGNKLLNIIDLTHPLAADMPTWDGKPGFDLSVKLDYKDCVPPDLFRTQKIKDATEAPVRLIALI